MSFYIKILKELKSVLTSTENTEIHVNAERIGNEDNMSLNFREFSTCVISEYRLSMNFHELSTCIYLQVRILMSFQLKIFQSVSFREYSTSALFKLG